MPSVPLEKMFDLRYNYSENPYVFGIQTVEYNFEDVPLKLPSILILYL